MSSLADEIEAIAAETGFSGVVSVDRGGEVEFAKAYGLAHRAHRIANTVGTRFAMASGSKAFTALAVTSLIDDGTLSHATTARSLLGADLPLVDDGVTVEQLLGHRSGMGDYLDENDDYGDIDDVMLPVSVHTLATTEPFVPLIDGFPAKFAPGERFAYCNGGYILLAVLAERASGVPFHDLVQARVFDPAGLTETGYPRSDDLPAGTAHGYLADGRSNVFHLPVRGNGDGGAYTTTADLTTFWAALLDGKIVPPSRVAEMIRPRSDVPEERQRYGLGFWLHETRDVVGLEGYDAGVSFRTDHDPATRETRTVIGNTSEGAWPIARRLRF